MANFAPKQDLKPTSANGSWVSPKAILSIAVASSLAFNPATSSASASECIIQTLPRTITGMGVKSAPRDTASAISEIRLLSGLTWEQIAGIFEVGRRSLHFWSNGNSVNSYNEEKIFQVLSTLQYINQGSARLNKQMLISPTAIGETPIALLKKNQFNEVRGLIKGTENYISARSSISSESKKSRRSSAPADMVGALQDVAHKQGKLIKTGSAWPKNEV